MKAREFAWATPSKATHSKSKSTRSMTRSQATLEKEAAQEDDSKAKWRLRQNALRSSHEINLRSVSATSQTNLHAHRFVSRSLTSSKRRLISKTKSKFKRSSLLQQTSKKFSNKTLSEVWASVYKVISIITLSNRNQHLIVESVTRWQTWSDKSEDWRNRESNISSRRASRLDSTLKLKSRKLSKKLHREYFHSLSRRRRNDSSSELSTFESNILNEIANKSLSKFSLVKREIKRTLTSSLKTKHAQSWEEMFLSFSGSKTARITLHQRLKKKNKASLATQIRFDKR